MTAPDRPGNGLTAVIPTAGNRPELRRAVEALISSATRAGGDAEVLVVVNGRRSVPVLDHVGSPLLRVLFLDRPNVSLARNTAIARARHDTLLFTDDDGVVGPDWCAQLRAGLATPRCALVAGPVRVPASGPVTAYLDYQRPFDASPDGHGGVLHPVTVNCGIRRDRLPGHVRFDEEMRIGQDVDFGHSVRATGAGMTWLADSAPVQHVLSDQFNEIGRRFLAYGSGIASITLKRDQAAARMTSVFLAVYQAMTAGGSGGFRRFTEFTRPRVRDTFTVLDHLQTAFFFIGYLRRASAEHGHQLITVDEERLQAACQEIADGVLEEAGGHTSRGWDELCPDYAMFGHAAGPEPPAIARVRDVLAAYARPAAARPRARRRPQAPRRPRAATAAGRLPGPSRPARAWPGPRGRTCTRPAAGSPRQTWSGPSARRACHSRKAAARSRPCCCANGAGSDEPAAHREQGPGHRRYQGDRPGRGAGPGQGRSQRRHLLPARRR